MIALKRVPGFGLVLSMILSVVFSIVFSVVFSLGLGLSGHEAHAQAPPPVVVKPKPAPKPAATQKAAKASPKSSAVAPDILFEGYSKLLIADQHSGFIIQRYEFDSAKKEFVYRHLLSAQDPSLQIRESLVARASAGFEPIGYQFTEQKGSELKVIDMTFSGGKMMGTIRSGTSSALKTERISREHPKGAFLAIFLPYVMLSGKEGLKAGVKYDYAAIAEEDGTLQKGSAFIEKEEAILGVRAFRTLIEFKGAKYTAFITGQGETIATRALANPVETQLVANSEDALKGQTVNRPAIEAVFGPMPRGRDNILARSSKAPAAPLSTPATAPAPEKSN